MVPIERIQRQIYLIRSQKVMLDADLAELYDVTTKALNQAVKRNSRRFPRDFAFRLTAAEAKSLRSQIVTSNIGRGGRRFLPYAFNEHGIAMLSSVLKSERAIQMNVLIIRAFIRMRDMLVTHKKLSTRIKKLEAGQQKHASVISILAEEIQEIRQLPPASTPKRRIGFENSARQGA